MFAPSDELLERAHYIKGTTATQMKPGREIDLRRLRMICTTVNHTHSARDGSALIICGLSRDTRGRASFRNNLPPVNGYGSTFNRRCSRFVGVRRSLWRRIIYVNAGLR